MKIELDFIKKNLDVDIFGDSKNEIQSIKIDSRSVNENECFIAFNGNKFNANLFLEDVLKKGASGVIIDKNFKENFLNSKFSNNSWCIAVDDTKKFLWNLALLWRNKYKNIPFIGITGSCGKTTTKDLIGKILKGVGYNPVLTKDSYNGFIGLPLTILETTDENNIAVCEVGISEKNEMEKFVSLLSPDIAILTNVGNTHLEGFESSKEVLKSEKLKIFSDLKNTKIAILNEALRKDFKESNNQKVITFGKSRESDVFFEIINEKDSCYNIKYSVFGKEINIKTLFFHEGFLFNIAAAFALLNSLNIEINDEVVKIVENYMPVRGRFSILKILGSKSFFIDDCYNANPESMKTSLSAFLKIKTELKKTIIIGDMFELGNDSIKLHENILSFLKENNQNINIFLTGNIFKKANEKFEFKHLDIEELKEIVHEIKNDSSLIFIKASRGMALDKIIEQFEVNQITQL